MLKKHPLLTGFPIVGAGDGGPPHPTIFFETLPPSKTMPSMGHTPPTRETPFHGMIPRKSTINSNLKYSWNPWKICVKFIFSKLAVLQAYSRQLYYRMNSFTGFFGKHFSPPPSCCPHVLSPPRPPPSNFEEPSPPPPCSQHLWETLINGDRCQ